MVIWFDYVYISYHFHLKKEKGHCINKIIPYVVSCILTIFIILYNVCLIPLNKVFTINIRKNNRNITAYATRT